MELEGPAPDAANALSSFLHVHFNRRFQRWNAIADQAKLQCVTPLVERTWTPFAQSRSLGKRFLDVISFNVLLAIIEHEYRDCRGAPAFCTHLLEVYRDGHLPCGWEGVWPQGKLLFY